MKALTLLLTGVILGLIAAAVTYKVRNPEGRLYRHQLELCAAIDKSSPTGGVVIIGDSMAQRLTGVAWDAVILGIGGETSEQLLARIGTYCTVSNASALVIVSGNNDRRFGIPPLRTASNLLHCTRYNRNTIIIGLCPVASPEQTAIADATNKLMPFATVFEWLQKDGRIFPTYDSGDGLHFSMQGNLDFRRHINYAVAGNIGKGGELRGQR